MMHLRCQKSDYEFSLPKEEVDGPTVPVGSQDPNVDDYMYMKVISNLASMGLLVLWKLEFVQNWLCFL